MFRTVRPDQIAKLNIREIEHGTNGIGVRAGVIKVATDVDGAPPANEVIQRAALHACEATGIPISIYSSPWVKNGGEQAWVFLDEGVDPAKVCIGRLNNTNDMA